MSASPSTRSSRPTPHKRKSILKNPIPPISSTPGRGGGAEDPNPDRDFYRDFPPCKRKPLPSHKQTWSNAKIDRLRRLGEKQEAGKRKTLPLTGGPSQTIVDRHIQKEKDMKKALSMVGQEKKCPYTINKYQQLYTNGFHYVCGDPTQRFREGRGRNIQAHNSIVLREGYDESEWPMWYFRQWEHLRPWHVEGEMKTNHYDKDGRLLALEKGYGSIEKVLDALTNDEFVSRPPMRDSLDWERYNARYVEPLLEPAREGDAPEEPHNIYTGRYWGDEEEEVKAKPSPKDKSKAKAKETPAPTANECIKGPNGETLLYISMPKPEDKPSFSERCKTFYLSHFMEPRAWAYNPAPYAPTKDWDLVARDIEQNRLEAAIKRQESFDERFRRAEEKVLKKRAKKAEKERVNEEIRARMMDVGTGGQWGAIRPEHQGYTTGL